MRSYPNPPLGFDSVHNPILACDSTEMLIGNRTSAYYRGRSALDSAGGLDPSGALPAPQMRPDRAEAIGQARASTDQSEPQALSKEHAASLIDLAHRAGANQTDLDGFGRVLSLLATGGEHGAPAAQDRNTGGGRKISRDTAIKAWKLAKDKLSPQRPRSIGQNARRHGRPGHGGHAGARASGGSAAGLSWPTDSRRRVGRRPGARF
jgi:hypothetical protein